MIALDQVMRLSAGRWTVPLLALAATAKGVRFVEVARRLGIARSMARRAVDEAVAAGWLARNPGHGHPLRPEYVLADDAIGAWCARVMVSRGALGLEPEALTRWTLPVVRVLAEGEARFSELEAALAPVSPRALSLTLKQAIATGLVARRLEDRFPPVALYGLGVRGKVLAVAMG